LPLAVVFGLFVGLLNLVPYLQNIAFIPAALFALVHSLETGQSFWVMMLLVLAIFAIVQLIQDAILTPKIMGDAIGLNPAVMLLSLSIWGKLLGLLGLIIALPMTFLLWSYYQRFLKKSDDEPETPLVPMPND
jgi:predicted PurR-regulated permease PerM